MEEAIPTSILDTTSAQRGVRRIDESESELIPAFIYVEKGPGSGQLIPLKQGVTVIGRASVVELRLQHPSISRRHSQLTRRGNRFVLRDLGSQNGTFVNRNAAKGDVEIFPGDEIAMGNAILRLRGPAQAMEHNGDRYEPVSAISTPRVRRVAAQPLSPLTRVAVLAGAIGFGLASVLLVAVLNLTRAQPEASSVSAVSLMDEARVGREAPDDSADALEAGADDDVRDNGVANAARIAAVTAKPTTSAKTAPAAKASAASSRKDPVPDEAQVARQIAPVKVAEPAQTRVVAMAAPAPAKVAEPARTAPEPKKSPEAEALARYEAGDLARAIELAGRSPLGVKMSKFKAAYDAGKRAFAARDGSTALRQFAAALKLDEEISKGWSKYGIELHAQLSQLYTLVGLQHLKAGSRAAARKAFQVAVKHDPKNARAENELNALAQTADDEDDGDEDEERTPAPRKTSTAKKTTNRAAIIDAAFD